MKTLVLFVVLLSFSACTYHRLQKYAPTESYPEDNWLAAQTTKRAVVIVAHDDDAISCAGTIAQLTQAGWEVNMLCFYNDVPADSARTAMRMQDVQRAAQIQGIRSVQFHQLNYRNDHGKNERLYGYLPPDARDTLFHMDTLRSLIQGFIDREAPTVIFTLDDVIGGYGHPDHAVMSAITKEYVLSGKSTAQRIYQAVFTPHQAETIMRDLPVYQEAKILCACPGQPLPHVQVNITDVGAIKRNAMLQYTTEQHNLQKFWPKYDRIPPEQYFSLFDREFFHVITR